MSTRNHLFYKLSILTLALVVLVSSLGIGSAMAASTSPKVQAIAAVEDTSVTFYAYYLPTNASFDVLLSKVGKDGVYTGENGTKVASFTSTASGTFEGTVNLPAALADYRQISIRIEGSGWFAYNFYDNYTWKGSVPVITPMPTEDVTVVKQAVKYQKKADVYLGNAGLYMPSSNYTGWVKLERFAVQDVSYARGMTFHQDLIDVGIYDSKMKLFEKVWGFNYLYFNLTSVTRSLYNKDKLNIYRYDASKRAWQACEVPVFVANKGKYGRLSCLINDFGIYALASK